MADTEAPRRRGPARRKRWWILLALLVVLVGWGVALASTGLAAYRADQQGVTLLDEVRSMNAADTVTSSATQDLLLRAHGQFSRAAHSLTTPWWGPVELLPVLGRQLRTVRALSLGAAQVTSVGAVVVARGHAILNEPHSSGAERIAALEQLSTIASYGATKLAAVSTGPSNALFGPVAAKRNQFVTELDDLHGQLQRAASATSSAATLLRGPSTILVLAANNAEMRAGSGSFLDVGTATAEGGELHLGALVPSGSIPIPLGEVTPSGDLEEDWGSLHPGVDWRNLGLTPQFEVNASLAARMWQAHAGQRVDAVVSIDVTGLQELLSITGPVTVSGMTFTADNVVPYLLHDQYIGLSDVATQDGNRNALLGQLASSVLHALQSSSLGLRTLSNAMAEAVDGRHLMIWSPDPATEADWVAAGAGGTLGTHSLDVTLINRGANKLDPYVPINVSVSTAARGAGERVTLRIAMANQTPPGQSQYIAGPYPGLGLSYGEYSGVLAVNLPQAARLVSLSGSSSKVVVLPEGPTWLVGTQCTLLPGQTRTFVVHFTLPTRSNSLVLEPSTRVPAEVWTTPSGHGTDAVRRTVVF